MYKVTSKVVFFLEHGCDKGDVVHGAGLAAELLREDPRADLVVEGLQVGPVELYLEG